MGPTLYRLFSREMCVSAFPHPRFLSSSFTLMEREKLKQWDGQHARAKLDAVSFPKVVGLHISSFFLWALFYYD